MGHAPDNLIKEETGAGGAGKSLIVEGVVGVPSGIGSDGAEKAFFNGDADGAPERHLRLFLKVSPVRQSRQAQKCRLYSALAGKGDGQGHRGLLGSVSALQRVVVGNNHLGGRCGGLGCGLVTQATL